MVFLIFLIFLCHSVSKYKYIWFYIVIHKLYFPATSVDIKLQQSFWWKFDQLYSFWFVVCLLLLHGNCNMISIFRNIRNTRRVIFTASNKGTNSKAISQVKNLYSIQIREAFFTDAMCLYIFRVSILKLFPPIQTI